jgi:hypothetical protein
MKQSPFDRSSEQMSTEQRKLFDEAVDGDIAARRPSPDLNQRASAIAGAVQTHLTSADCLLSRDDLVPAVLESLLAMARTVPSPQRLLRNVDLLEQ